MQFPTENSARVLRHQIEHKKLVDIARHVAAVCPFVDSYELDVRAAEQSAKCGFSSHDLVCVRLWVKGAGFTAILVPLRFWYKPLWFNRAVEFRDYLRRAGHRCLIAPTSVVMKQPRLANARLIASCTGHTVKITDQVTVLDRLVEMGGMSLQDASHFVKARDPAGAILSMVSRRQVAIDISKPIGPHSMLTALT